MFNLEWVDNLTYHKRYLISWLSKTWDSQVESLDFSLSRTPASDLNRINFWHSEHCESIGENQMNLQTGSIGDLNLPELSNSFRNKLAQWDDLGIVQRSNVDLRRKKRGSSSASAVLQRMSLPGKNTALDIVYII